MTATDPQPGPDTAPDEILARTRASARAKARAAAIAVAHPGGRLLRLRIWRMPLGQLSAARLFRGGRPGDTGRLPRYAGLFVLGAAAIWVPISAYLATAPLRFTSDLSLILPGAGASASVNLDQIGQASSSSASPFASSSISPTETYKRLLGADRILSAASTAMGMAQKEYGQPRIELVDQTGLIRVQIVGNSPEDARARGEALLGAFYRELDALRGDEQFRRTDGESGALEEYKTAVTATRAEISRLQRETGLISAAQYAALVSETDALRARTRDLSAALAEKIRNVAALEEAAGLGPRQAAAALKLNADAEYAGLLAAKGAAAATASAAIAAYGPNHPERRAAEAALATARDRLLAHAVTVTGLSEDEAGRLDLAPAGPDRAALLKDLVTEAAARDGMQAELAAMQERLAGDEARVLALIEPAARLEDSERNFSVAEAVFASALARTKTSKADLYASYPLVQVLEDPSLPVEPSSPKRKLALAAGVAATLFLLTGLILAWLRRPLIGRLLSGPGDAPGEATA